MAQVVKRGDNRWQVLVYRGRDSQGKRLFHIKTVRGTKKAALAYARDVENALSAGTYSTPTSQTVAGFLTDWLQNTAYHRLRRPTLLSYSKLVDNYISPALGLHRLAQLRLPDINRLYAQMRQRGLSPRTVRYTHSVLRSAMNHAVLARLITHNPTDHATLPREERKEMRCLSLEETVQFLSAARNSRWHALFELLALGGLRPGEALALRWGDIQGSTISVQRTLTLAGSQWQTSEPKTRRSRRTLPIGDSTVRALQTHRRRQAEEKLFAGERYIDSDFVFAGPTGAPLDIKNLTHRHFHKVLGEAGIPRIRLYDLRHTAATLMLAAGVNPKVASERLGHSTITLTMDTYSHVLPAMQLDAVDRVDRLIASAS